MSCIYEDSLKIRNHFFHTCICENDIKSTIFHKIDIIIFLTQRHILRTGKLFFPHKPGCCLHLCRILSFKNFLPDCFRHHLLVYHKDFLSLIVQIRNQLTCCRITDLIRRTKGLFQIFGYFQCCRRYNNIFANFRCPFYCLKPIVYEHPELTPAQRHEEWKKLAAIYQPWMRLDGEIPFYGAGEYWQRQMHIYQSPFYYIDYCLAQTVSLQFWAMLQKDRADAWSHYMAYTKQGGSRTFTELLKNAGLTTPFEESCLRGVSEAAKAWLDSYDLTGIL